MGAECVSHRFAHAGEEFAVFVRICDSQIDVYDWECVHVSRVLRMFGDLQPFEPAVSLVPDVEERIQHGQVRGLAESARTCEQIDSLVVGSEDVCDQTRLVDVVLVPLADFRERHPSEVYLLHGVPNLMRIHIHSRCHRRLRVLKRKRERSRRAAGPRLRSFEELCSSEVLQFASCFLISVFLEQVVRDAEHHESDA